MCCPNSDLVEIFTISWHWCKNKFPKRLYLRNNFSLIPPREMRFWSPGVKQQKWSIPRSMMSPCDKTYFSTLVMGKFGNIQIPTWTVNLPYSAWEKCYVLVVVVASINCGPDHFCCFAPHPDIFAYSFNNEL